MLSDLLPRRIGFGTISISLAVVLALSGCATVGGPAARRTPDWVLESPEAGDAHEYFVATGTDSDGDLQAAEEAAAASLLTQINQALGVDVSVLTTSEARSTLDSYEASVRQEVTQAGSGRVEGFRIADRFVVDEGNRVAVHLLGEYERAAFLAERDERRALLAAREALLMDPEREADAAAAEGRLFDALRGYLGAAVAAARAEDGLRIAPVVLERAMRKAAELVAGIEIRPVSGPVRVETGSVPEEPIQFFVVDPSGKPVPGVPVEISYHDAGARRTVVRRATLTTNGDGLVRFEYPAVDIVGDVAVNARIDTSGVDEQLRSLPAAERPERAALEAAIADARAVWHFAAYSRAHEIPTSVLIAETDAAGVPLATSRTGDGVIQSLSTAGFRLPAAGVDPAATVGLAPADLVRHLQTSLPADARRAVVGTASIVDVSENGGFLVKVTANVSVVDLASGEIVYATSAVKNARSASVDQAITTAFLQLGRGLGEELAARLP